MLRIKNTPVGWQEILANGEQIDCSHRKGSDTYPLEPNTIDMEARNADVGNCVLFCSVLRMYGACYGLNVCVLPEFVC